MHARPEPSKGGSTPSQHVHRNEFWGLAWKAERTVLPIAEPQRLGCATRNSIPARHWLHAPRNLRLPFSNSDYPNSHLLDASLSFRIASTIQLTRKTTKKIYRQSTCPLFSITTPDTV